MSVLPKRLYLTLFPPFCVNLRKSLPLMSLDLRADEPLRAAHMIIINFPIGNCKPPAGRFAHEKRLHFSPGPEKGGNP
jgi:hypothetical protein